MAGTAQRWIATEHVAFVQQRHEAGDCPDLSRTLPKFHHRTTASKLAWPFWILNFRWRLSNASHLWLCFPISLCCLLFFLHSFPTSLFAVLGGSYCRWRASESCLVLLFLPTEGERNIPRENYFWGHKKQHVLIGSHPQQWSIPESTRHVYNPLYAPSGRFVHAKTKSRVRPKRMGAVIYGCMPSVWN